MQLFNRTPACHTHGICQRTSPQCHRACHQAMPSARAEATIGYEAAPASNVHQLHATLRQCAYPDSAGPEEMPDRPADNWVTVANLLAGGVAFLGVLSAIALIAFSLVTPGSWLHQLGWAALHLGS